MEVLQFFEKYLTMDNEQLLKSLQSGSIPTQNLINFDAFISDMREHMRKFNEGECDKDSQQKLGLIEEELRTLENSTGDSILALKVIWTQIIASQLSDLFKSYGMPSPFDEDPMNPTGFTAGMGGM